MISWIKNLLGINTPEITIKYGHKDEEEQTQEIKIYKDGEHSHTVIAHYFTREQINRIQGGQG